MAEDDPGLRQMFEDFLAQIFDEDYSRMLSIEDPVSYKFLLEQFSDNYER